MRNAATASSLNGAGRTCSAPGACRSASSSDVRAAGSAGAERHQQRGAEILDPAREVLDTCNEDASPQCASSTATSSGRQAPRPATSQKTAFAVRKAIGELDCLAADIEYTCRGCGGARQQLVSRPLIDAAHERLEQLSQ